MPVMNGLDATRALRLAKALESWCARTRIVHQLQSSCQQDGQLGAWTVAKYVHLRWAITRTEVDEYIFRGIVNPSGWSKIQITAFLTLCVSRTEVDLCPRGHPYPSISSTRNTPENTRSMVVSYAYSSRAEANQVRSPITAQSYLRAFC